MKRISVSKEGGKAAIEVERCRVCSGVDFSSEIRSAFRVLSGNFKPVSIC